MEKRRRIAKVLQIIILAFLALTSVGVIHRATLPSIKNLNEAAAADVKIQPSPWPPVVGQAFPDLELVAQNGGKLHVSDFKGKVVVIEPIGMNCQACQAWSGAHDVGSFENNAVQPGLVSFKRMLPVYAGGLSLPSDDVVLIQLLLYDMKLNAPTPEDAKKWADHFGFTIENGEFVTVAPGDLRNNASYAMIPGFFLLDRNGILRSDATGHTPRDNLYKTLLPMVPRLVAEGGASQ